MIHDIITRFLDSYLMMNISGTVIHCPYWMNKLKNGVVAVRGFENGKGGPDTIRKKLQEEADRDLPEKPPADDLYLLAKQKRIGLDCSGFAYQMLGFFTASGIITKTRNPDEIFPGGINRTNVKKLTDGKFSEIITAKEDVGTGDLIRMQGGNHILVVIGTGNGRIWYAHSSSAKYTRVSGVHLGEIIFTNKTGDLRSDTWEEKTVAGISYGRLLVPEKGDGIYRLRNKNG